MVCCLYGELCDGVLLVWRVVSWCVVSMESCIMVCCMYGALSDGVLLVWRAL